MKDSHHHFRTLDLQEDLVGRSVRGGTVAFAAQGVRFLINVGSTVVLARILTPLDFGVVAMVAAATGFLTIMRDLGLATATVQSEEIDQTQVSTLFWLNAIAGVALAIAISLASPAIAAFFKEPRLAPVAIVFGVLAFIESLGTQPSGLLRRRMRFSALAIAEVGSLLAGTITGVIMALRGMGYWSLVGMRVVTESTRVGCLWLFCDWRPDCTIAFHRVRSQLAFGGFITLSQFLRYVTRHVDRLLIGRVFGPESLGLYGRARGWLVSPDHLISVPMSRVAVPVLSRLRGESERFRAWFRAGLGILATLAIPAVAFLFADTRAVVLLILGDQWLAAIPIFRLLAPVSIAAIANIGFQWCYVSLGRAERQLRWELVVMIATVTAFLVGMRWGVGGVAAAWSFVSLILLVPGALYCFRGSPVEFSDLATAFAAPLAGAIPAAAAVRLFSDWRPIESIPTAVVIHAALFVGVYLMIWIGLPGGRDRARLFIGLARRLRPFPSPSLGTTGGD